MDTLVQAVCSRSGHPLGGYLPEETDVTVTATREVPMSGTEGYLWVAGESCDAVVDAFRAGDLVTSLTRIECRGDRTLLRVELASDATGVCRAVANADGSIVRLRGTSERWTLLAGFPDRQAMWSFSRDCREKAIGLSIRRTYVPGVTEAANPVEEMSDRQITALELAFESGYFEVPRRGTLTDITPELGVSEQAASQRIRRGLRTLLAYSGLESEDAINRVETETP